jgi:CheY-like chemotaxis protein
MKKLIYIAEDEIAYSKVYKSKLEAEGFDVVAITEGDKVLPELHKKLPDLLVLDLVMPGANGFEILEAIRGDAKLKSLNVIVASNLSQEIDLEKAKKYGVKNFFVKADVYVSEMVKNIKEALGD